MTVLDEVLAANAAYASRFRSGDLPAPPSRHLAVLTCMDARIMPLAVFGLENGDAHILRNAGGRVTEDVLRSLLVSTHVLEVREVAVVHHTECGMVRYTDDDLRAIVESGTGKSVGDLAFYAISDPQRALEIDVARLTDSGLLHPDTIVQGFQYDVRTGLLHRRV